MNAGCGMALSINVHNNLNLLGDDMVFLVPRSTILNVLQCGLAGGTWDSQELKQLVEKSIAVIPSTSSPNRVGVFVDQDSYLESFELACQLHTLKQQIAEYMIEEALKEQARMDESEEIDARADLLLDPDYWFCRTL